MRFITEDELRLQYESEPFTRYTCPPNARITPGARQFLIDRRIAFETEPTPRRGTTPEPTADTNVVMQLAFSKLQEMELTLALAAIEWQNDHADLAAELTRMADSLMALRQWCRQPAETLLPPGSDETFQTLAEGGNCSEGKRFHISSAQKAVLIKCRLLQCQLQQVLIDLRMILPETDETQTWYAQVAHTLNHAINRLSEWICNINGGDPCQRI